MCILSKKNEKLQGSNLPIFFRKQKISTNLRRIATNNGKNHSNSKKFLDCLRLSHQFQGLPKCKFLIFLHFSPIL